MVNRHLQTVADPQTQGWCSNTQQILHNLEQYGLNNAWATLKECAATHSSIWKQLVNQVTDSYFDNIRSEQMEILDSLERYRKIKECVPQRAKDASQREIKTNWV